MSERSQVTSSGQGIPLPEEFGFGQLFHVMPDAAVVGDVDTGRIVLWNPAAADMFGIPVEEAIGLPIETLIPELLRERHRAGLAAFRESGHGTLVDTGAPVEMVAVRRTGGQLTIELRLSLVAASRRPGCFVLAMIRDITTRREAEKDRLRLAGEQAARTTAEEAMEALRQSEERFRAAFYNAPIGMDMVDMDGRFLRANAKLCELTGYSEPELLTMTFADVTHPDDQEADFAQVEQLIAGEIPAYLMDKRYIRKDGQVVWGRVNSSLVRDQHGEPLYFIGHIEDITTRLLAEEALQTALASAQAANEAKGTFLAMMSHELRTPLQATLGYSEFLLAGDEGSLTSEQRQDVLHIHQASQRMIDLVNQVLDLSRMDADRLNLAREQVDMAQVMEQVRQDVAPQAMTKGLSLQIDIPADLPPALADANGVRQILLNLVDNAVKFTQAGDIRVAASTTSTGVMEIAVRDSGIGIPPDVLPHVFDEFRQGDSRLSRRFGGAGLGLAIARRLAVQMGGEIRVTSTPGVGSTFRLFLPLAEEPMS